MYFINEGLINVKRLLVIICGGSRCFVVKKGKHANSKLAHNGYYRYNL